MVAVRGSVTSKISRQRLSGKRPLLRHCKASADGASSGTCQLDIGLILPRELHTRLEICLLVVYNLLLRCASLSRLGLLGPGLSFWRHIEAFSCSATVTGWKIPEAR